MRTRTTALRPLPRLCLEDGADESAPESLHLEERGVTFESPWYFPLMAEVTVCLTWHHARLGWQRTPLEGVVVQSQRSEIGGYETTVLFPDLPDECRAEVLEFARLTAAE